jgi:hypothetical protein
MNNYKAKADQWDELEGWAGHGSTVACILELRDRVMALEANANHIGDINKMVPPPVATDTELEGIWDRSSDFEPALRAIYDLGVAHGQARSQEVAEPAPVAGGLVVRVAHVIDTGSGEAEARAAILEVAGWLRSYHLIIPAKVLEKEAGR